MSFAKESRYVNCSTTFRINENVVNFQPIFSILVVEQRDSIFFHYPFLPLFQFESNLCLYVSTFCFCTSWRRSRREKLSADALLENRKLNFTSMTKASSGCCCCFSCTFSPPLVSDYFCRQCGSLSDYVYFVNGCILKWSTLHHLITTPIPFTF